MKNFFCFIFILFFICVVSAGEFSISPPQIDLIGIAGVETCGNFIITTSEDSILIGEDRWGIEGETRRKFSAHTLSPKTLNLEVIYPKLIESNGEITSKICVSGQEKGNYHGLLLYRLEGKPTGVGIWLNVSVSEREKRTLGLTGFGIEGEKGGTEVWLVGITLILIVILALFLRKSKQKKFNS